MRIGQITASIVTTHQGIAAPPEASGQLVQTGGGSGKRISSGYTIEEESWLVTQPIHISVNTKEF